MKIAQFINEANKIWDRLSESEEQAIESLQIELNLYKKLLVFFQIGESCYFIYSFQLGLFDFVSNEVEDLLGYAREDITSQLYLEIIHPDDRLWFLNCQETAGQFLLGLSPEKQMKYKMRFDFRMLRKDGKYIRVMMQVVVAQNDLNGKILRTLIILTDISHLKKHGRSIMSYIGMDGEPSYLDVDIKSSFSAEKETLSDREKEVLYMLIDGKNSKEIADELCLSKHTIDSHRKNMLRKTKTLNTAELINKAITNGLI